MSVLLLSAGLSSGIAHAELIETDWQNLGDNLSVLDTNSGMEWLDLSQTLAMTVGNVIGQMDSPFSGWRLPSYDEVHALLDDYESNSGRSAIMDNMFDVRPYSVHRIAYGLHINSSETAYTLSGPYGPPGYPSYGEATNHSSFTGSKAMLLQVLG